MARDDVDSTAGGSGGAESTDLVRAVASGPHVVPPEAEAAVVGLDGKQPLMPSPGFGAALGWFEDYLTLERDRSAHTVCACMTDIGLFLAHAEQAGVTDLRQLGLRHFRTWLGVLDDAGLARSTLARRVASVRTFMDWAVREELIPSNPALRLSAARGNRSLPTVLTQSQARMLFQDTGSSTVADADLLQRRAILEVLYGTGVRVGELTGLDIDDLDIERRTLVVTGKGDKQRTVPYGRPPVTPSRCGCAANDISG